MCNCNNGNRNTVIMPQGKIRYRTFKVYDDGVESKLLNGDIIIAKKLLGKITAITIPIDKEFTKFMVDFSFCSIKDKYCKKTGKEIAFNRLLNQITFTGNPYIIDRSILNISVNDVIKNMIVNEFSDKIMWIKNIRENNII